MFGALVTGLGLAEDMKTGVVDRFRSLPIARSAVLIGPHGRRHGDERHDADGDRDRRVIIGFRPSEPVYDLLLAFGLVLAFAYVFSWISAFVGLSVKNPETAQSVGFVWVFPLAWLVGLLIVFVPLAVRAFRRA